MTGGPDLPELKRPARRMYRDLSQGWKTDCVRMRLHEVRRLLS